MKRLNIRIALLKAFKFFKANRKNLTQKDKCCLIAEEIFKEINSSFFEGSKLDSYSLMEISNEFSSLVEMELNERANKYNALSNDAVKSIFELKKHTQ